MLVTPQIQAGVATGAEPVSLLSQYWRSSEVFRVGFCSNEWEPYLALGGGAGLGPGPGMFSRSTSSPRLVRAYLQPGSFVPLLPRHSTKNRTHTCAHHRRVLDLCLKKRTSNRATFTSQ
jgi:hypothetical protein